MGTVIEFPTHGPVVSGDYIVVVKRLIVQPDPNDGSPEQVAGWEQSGPSFRSHTRARAYGTWHIRKSTEWEVRKL
jgi:hypothetical protein